jgi:hypothetical protein
LECGISLLCLLAIGLLVLLVVVHQRSKRALEAVAELKQVNARAWDLLRGQIRGLEEELARMKAGMGASLPEASAAPPLALPDAPPAATAPPAPPAGEPAVTDEHPPVPAPSTVQVPPFAPPAPARLAPRPEPVPSPSPRPQAPPPPSPGPLLLERLRGFNWEELLGTQVFLRLGVAVVVLGIVLFLGYVFATLGPVGKVSMGVGAALAMILGGLYGEAKEDWRTFGRVVLAGGWGVLYFSAFAMRFIAASRVIDSTPTAVLLLLAVAAGAVAFSLRYRQEWTTAFAFLLIFLSLGLAAVELQAPFTRPAVFVAAAALGFLAWRMAWARLLGLGALASWACLGLGTAQHAPGDLALPWAWACLLGTWTAFTLPVLRWRGEGDEGWLGGALVAGGMALLGLGLQEGFAAAPEQVWILPLLYGAAGLCASFLLRARARHGLFKVQSLLALLALGLMGPLRMGFRSGWLPVLRMAGLQALLAAGIHLRERFFRLLAWVGFALTFAEILFLRIGLFGPGAPDAVRLAMLLAAASLPLLNAFLLRRPWRPWIEEGEAGWMPAFFSASGALFLACLIWLHAPHGAVAVLLLSAALAFQEAALRSGFPELPWLSAGLGALAIVGLFTVSLPALAQGGRLRLLAWVAASLGFYLGHGRAALASGDERGWRRPAGRLQLIAGLGLALALTAQEAPASWVAPLLALLALLHLGVGLRARRTEWIATSGVAWLAAGGAVASLSLGLSGRSFGLNQRLLSVGAVLALGYAGRLMLRRSEDRGALGDFLGWALGLTLPVLLSVLIWLEAPPLGVAPLLSLALLVHAWAALRGAGAEGLAQVGELLLASGIALILKVWPMGSLAFFSPRLGAVTLTVLGWVLAHLLFHREERRGHALAARPAWSWVTDSLPPLGALGLALATKGEALAHDKNLLVALLLGLLGLACLEGARILRRRVWFWTFATALAAGAVHLLLVNVPQEGDLHRLSLRTLTVLPFLGVLAYAHLTLKDAGEELNLPDAASRGRAMGIFTGAVLAASYLLYELHRAAVIAAWAALALGYLGAWLRWRSVQLRWSALGLLVAVLVRALAINLPLRDSFQGLRLNLLVVPAACVLLLAGFLLLNRVEQEQTPTRFGAAGSRWWLLGTLALTTAHVWVEASGKILTIGWSLEGLAAVGLGFLVSERWARLAGLSLLSFCILKLFVYDLRGLEGMARILSFIVLGLVLVGVSWVYTRFKERLL